MSTRFKLKKISIVVLIILFSIIALNVAIRTVHAGTTTPVIKYSGNTININKSRYLQRESERLSKDKQALAPIIRLIPEDPLEASKQLKTLNTPQAKLFLAYLYQTEMVKIKDKNKVVIDLMSNFYPIEISEVSLEGIFTQMNLHLDSIPWFLIKEHPLEASNYLGGYYGSTKDIFLPPYVLKNTIMENRHFSHLKRIFYYFGSDFSLNYTGTIKYSYYRRENLYTAIFSTAPEFFLRPDKQKEAKSIKSCLCKDIDKELRQWAYKNNSLKSYKDYRKTYVQTLHSLEFYLKKYFDITDKKKLKTIIDTFSSLTFHYARCHSCYSLENNNRSIYEEGGICP